MSRVWIQGSPHTLGIWKKGVVFEPTAFVVVLSGGSRADSCTVLTAATWGSPASGCSDWAFTLHGFLKFSPFTEEKR